MNYRYIIDLVGYDSFYKGRFYGYGSIQKINTNKLSDSFIHEYKVKSERTRKWYDVKIKNNGAKVLGYGCNCPQFSREKTCKHLAAVLIQDMDEIEEYEIIDELKASESILDRYNINTKNQIKQKLGLEIEFDFNYGSAVLRVYIGNEKKYVLSTITKLRNFFDSYRNNYEYKFGKNLIYENSKYYFDKKDIQILEYIEEVVTSKEGYYSNNTVFLSNMEFKNLLDLLENKEFSIMDHGKVYNVYSGMPTKYVLDKNNNNFVLNIEDYENYRFLDEDYRYIIYNHNMYILNKEESDYLKLLRQEKINNLTFEKKDLNKFSSGLFNKVKNNITISDDVTEINLPVTPNVKLYFDISYSKLKCDIIFDYNGKEINYFDKVNILRDNDFENEIINEIVSYGFIEDNKKFIMQDDDMYYFLDEEISRLNEKYEVFTSKKIDDTKILKKVSANNNFSIGQDGIMTYKFDVDGINTEDLNNIFSALKQKKKYYKLKNNNVVSLENNEELNELNNLVNELSLSKEDILNGDATIPKYRALYIDSLKKTKYKNIKTNNLFDEFITNFKKYKDLEIEFDKNDEKILRDYQKDGVKWLNTIYKCDLGGILADEMGLGKSIQTIMFIKEVLKEKENAKIIIVVPTSLMYNWQKEFEKFAPNLKYVVVADNKQKRKEIFEKKDDYNIFITSYGLIRNDKDEYENVDFELCIVDEAQNIKNYQAEMTKEIKKIKAKCKIALTGTPLENNVTELWSIFDFIMPGYLNSVIKFREKYNVKDVDEEGLKLLENLNHQIKPFILRRKKQDVVKSLPKKIENKIYIELPEKQKMLYMKVLNDTKKEMDEMISEGGFQKSRMKILQLLTKLRQICIDPSVMYENYNGESIKIEELLRVVKEAIENGHKILVFSSFKRVLDNVKDIFNKNKITYYMIDGSVKSKDRMVMVEKFNNDDTNCFLITLKSGGTGLNLTGADTVIHLDIWWNPQVENQATDRAHRIGQTKTVSVIKLVTKGTIEERIIELQDKKKILSENLIEGKNDSESLSSLTEKDIRNLLSIGE